MAARVLIIPAVLVFIVGVVAIGFVSKRSHEQGKLSEVAVLRSERIDSGSASVLSVPGSPEPAVVEVDRVREGVLRARPTSVGDDKVSGLAGRVRGPSLGDSPMSPEEWARRWTERQSRRQSWISQFDTDGDGELNDQEREAMREQMQARRKELMLRRLAPRFDADGDGELNDAERAEAEVELAVIEAERRARMFERFDSNGDGRLTSDESRRARRSGNWSDAGRRVGQVIGPRRALEQYDADGDGRLDIDESYEAYLDKFLIRQQRLFVRQYDADGNGVVDSGDLESFLARYRDEDPAADVNGDGRLSQQDVERFRDLMIASP